MRLKTIIALAVLTFSTASYAEFEEWKDYVIKDEVVSMTTIKVDAGKGEDYLEGLAQTWVATNEIAKNMGQINDYSIYISRLPESGDFNVVLIITMDSMSNYVWTEKQAASFRKKWGERNRKASRETAKNYPELRTITGEYLLGEVELK